MNGTFSLGWSNHNKTVVIKYDEKHIFNTRSLFDIVVRV
jgi:hypothetical protein